MFKQFVRARTAVLAMLLALLATGAVMAVSAPAQAASTRCTTMTLNGDALGFAVRPRMQAPVCYNGSRIWINGNVTPGVSTVGYNVGGFDWYGSYQDGRQNWIGVGENFAVTLWTGAYSTYCTPRWLINPNGGVYSYSRGC